MYINGEATEGLEGLTIREVLESMSYEASRIAVEVNEEIIAKSKYDSFVVGEEDHIQIVCFVGGG